MAFILSYAVVNIFYPKETNLILGLCIGGAVGFAQWLVLKKYFKIKGWWIFASAIGIGIPYIVEVIFDETGIILPESFNNEYFSRFIIGCFGGFLSGMLQVPTLKSLSQYSGWWVVISTIGWGIAMLPLTFVAYMVLGGIELGALLGFSVLWLLKFPLEEPLIKKSKWTKSV